MAKHEIIIRYDESAQGQIAAEGIPKNNAVAMWMAGFLFTMVQGQMIQGVKATEQKLIQVPKLEIPGRPSRRGPRGEV